MVTALNTKVGLFRGREYLTNVVEGKCQSKLAYQTRKQRLTNEAAARQVVKKELLRKTRIAEEQAAAEALERHKYSCTSYGFAPNTDGHAKCVMELSLAEQDANRQTRAAADANLHPCSTSRTGQEQWTTEEVADCYIRQARHEIMAKKSNRKGLSQESAQALIRLGTAISSGQAVGATERKPSQPLPPSGRYKSCNYRVAGELVAMTIGRAEACATTRTIGGKRVFSAMTNHER